MLFSFGFRWESAALPTRVPSPPCQSPPPQVRQGQQARPCPLRLDQKRQKRATDSMHVSRAPLSVCGLTRYLFLLRFVFSPACENPSESTTVQRTKYRSSQVGLCLHSCTGSSASRPEQACDLSQAEGWQRSAACARPRLPKVVFILLPALVSTRKRLCP